MNITVDDVVSAFNLKNKNGDVVYFDFPSFDKFVSALISKRKEIRIGIKEEEKERELEAKDLREYVGKEYYNSLEEGDEFFYKNFKGNIVRARKLNSKCNNNNAAVCEVISGIDCDKTKNRAVPFHQIIINEQIQKEILLRKEQLEKNWEII